jgi:hypothetical protein
MVRGGRASTFTLDEGMFQIRAARSLEDLAAAFAQEATHRGPLAGQEVLVWPAILKALTLLWGEGDPSAPFSRAEATERLRAHGLAEPKIAPALDEMVQTKILDAGEGRLRVSDWLRPWLERVWSGHAFQVEYLALPPGQGLDAVLQQQGEHLVFVGPPGQRVLSDQLTGDRLIARLQGRAAAEDRAVRLCALPPDALRTAMRRLLRLEPKARSAD